MAEVGNGKPGATGDPLGDEDIVMRFPVLQSRLDAISAAHFSPNSEEDAAARVEGWLRLSVWAEHLISEAQALAQLKPARRAIIRLKVAEVRGIVAFGVHPLDVLWDRLPNCIDDQGLPLPGHTRGCEGHCGLTLRGEKSVWKEARRQLVVIASQNWHVYEGE